jgi:hypothetical protein
VQKHRHVTLVGPFEESQCVSPGFGKGPILSSYRYYPGGALRSEIQGAPLSWATEWSYELPDWPRAAFTSPTPPDPRYNKPTTILERDSLGNWAKFTDGSTTYTRELVYDARGNWIYWRGNTGAETRREVLYY